MTFRERVVSGGVHMVARQLVVLGLGIVGAIALTRLLGPRDYGRYAGGLAIVLFITALSRAGVDLYLIRRPQIPTRQTYEQAFALMLLSGLVFGVGGSIVVPIAVGWVSNPTFAAPTRWMLLALPLTVAALPWLAALERELEYRTVAFVEVAGHVVFIVSAVVLAAVGWGIWGPVTAYWLWQITLVSGVLVFGHFRPRARFSRAFSREALSYGLRYSGSDLLWRSRDLVNPLVVGRYLGPRGVAYVSLAVTIVGALSFAKSAAGRVLFSAVSRIRDDRGRLRTAADEGMVVLTFAVGVMLALFASVADWVVPIFLGDDWLPILDIYPLLALAGLVNAIFNVHSIVLYSFGRIGSVAFFHAVSSGIVAVAAIVLVPIEGLNGFALAETAAIAAYVLLHLAMVQIVRLDYTRAGLCFAGFGPTLFTPSVDGLLKLVLWIPLVVVLALPVTRHTLRRYLDDLRGRSGTGSPAQV